MTIFTRRSWKDLRALTGGETEFATAVVNNRVSTVSFLPTFESRILAKARGAGCAERRCHPPNMNGYAACHTVEAGFFADRTCRGAPPAAIPYVRPADRHSPPFATLGRINGVIADVRGGCHSTVRYIAPDRKFGGKPGKTIAHIQILQYCVTRTQHSCCSHKRVAPAQTNTDPDGDVSSISCATLWAMCAPARVKEQ